MRFRILLGYVAFSLLFLIGCEDSKIHSIKRSFSTEAYKQTQLGMGTEIEISVVVSDEKKLKEVDRAIDKAFAEIRRIEDLMSRYKAASEVSRLNEGMQQEGIQVSDELMAVCVRAIEFNELTHGAFDITVLPLVELWGVGSNTDYHRLNTRILTDKDKKSFILPSEEEIAEKLLLVGSDKIIIDKEGNRISFAVGGMGVDLGGIATGYAVDKAIEILKKEGIAAGLVNAGGDMYCLGTNPRGQPWSIGVQHPRDSRRILTALKVKDRAVTTSGDYERYFIVDGRRYGHIIDPRSGYPVQHGPVSVTVLAEDCLTADALATAVFVLGTEQGLELINSQSGAEGIIVYEDEGRLKAEVSEGLQGELKFDF